MKIDKRVYNYYVNKGQEKYLEILKKVLTNISKFDII